MFAGGFLDDRSDRLRLVRLSDLFEYWQSALRRSYKEIPCHWIIPGHGPRQLKAELRSCFRMRTERLMVAAAHASALAYSPRQMPSVSFPSPHRQSPVRLASRGPRTN
jgi:hypothetical protein